jgi:hypothetical protein
MFATVAAGGDELPADGLVEAGRQRLGESAGQGLVLMRSTDAGC